jgi:hypothetical protein
MRNVNRPIQVSVTLPTTTPTLKRLSTSVGLPLDRVDALALMAGLTRVGRIDQHQRNTRTHTFVGQELTQLVERPTVGVSTFCLTSWLLIRALSNARQLFDSNAPAIGFCLFDKSVTNSVVDVGLESSFSARQPFLKLPHPTASTSRAFTGFVLKLRSLLGALVSQLGQLLSTEAFSLGSVCNICTAKVYPQTIGRFFRIGIRWLAFDLNLDVVGAIVSLYQRGRSWFLAFKQILLVLTNRQSNTFDSATQQRYIHCPIRLIHFEDLVVQGQACGLEGFDRLLILLGRFAIARNPGDGLASQVGRQAEQDTRRVVNFPMNFDSARDFWIDSGIHPIAGIGKCLKCRINLLTDFGGDEQLARDCQNAVFHSNILIHIWTKVHYLRVVMPFSVASSHTQKALLFPMLAAALSKQSLGGKAWYSSSGGLPYTVSPS